jgi:hypothetical protein
MNRKKYAKLPCIDPMDEKQGTSVNLNVRACFSISTEPQTRMLPSFMSWWKKVNGTR